MNHIILSNILCKVYYDSYRYDSIHDNIVHTYMNYIILSNLLCDVREQIEDVRDQIEDVRDQIEDVEGPDRGC